MEQKLTELKNGILTVQVAARGAELQSIRDAAGREYLWQGDPVYWADRALNIFPYVARLTEGKYTYRGKTYSMDIHGFVPWTRLQAEEVGEKRAVFGLRPDETIRKQYPFEFHYRVCYELDGSDLRITYRVDNEGKDTMYFGLGGHPGFRVPMEEGRDYEGYYLQFEKGAEPVRIGFTEDCFLSGEDTLFALEPDERLRLRHELFDDDAVVLSDAGNSVSLQAEKGGARIRVIFPEMRYLGIWSAPKTDAPYVCLEPWTSLPSRQGIVEDLEKQPDLVTLGAGESYQNTWIIRIEENV